MDELTVDVGAASAAEVSAMGLGVGSVGTFDVQFRRIGEHALLGKAFDDRSGCTMLLHLARLFAEQAPRNQLLFNFSCGEEVPGHRGARIAARNEAADLVIVLENTTATDTPGVPEHKVITRAGAGPALTLADKSHIAPEALVTRLTALADAEGIPWQYKMPVYGSTNAGELSWTAGGVPTGVISVPCRYIHAPAGLIRIDDLLHSLSLVHRICNEPLQ
jgi:endoglucanase